MSAALGGSALDFTFLLVFQSRGADYWVTLLLCSWVGLLGVYIFTLLADVFFSDVHVIITNNFFKIGTM